LEVSRHGVEARRAVSPATGPVTRLPRVDGKRGGGDDALGRAVKMRANVGVPSGGHAPMQPRRAELPARVAVP